MKTDIKTDYLLQRNNDGNINPKILSKIIYNKFIRPVQTKRSESSSYSSYWGPKLKLFETRIASANISFGSIPHELLEEILKFTEGCYEIGDVIEAVNEQTSIDGITKSIYQSHTKIYTRKIRKTLNEPVYKKALKIACFNCEGTVVYDSVCRGYNFQTKAMAIVCSEAANINDDRDVPQQDKDLNGFQKVLSIIFPA